MAVVLHPFVPGIVGAATLVLAACVGGPGDPSGNDEGAVDPRGSSRQSDEPKLENAEPQDAGASSDGGAATQ